MFDLETIRQQNPIEKIISDRAGDLHLKPRQGGTVLRGFCPFHSEHETPSFDVWPDEWRFRCWTEGIYGSGIDFVMKWEGLDFKTACERLGGESKLSREETAALKKEHDDERAKQLAAEQAEIDRLRKVKATEHPWDSWCSGMTTDQAAYWRIDVGLPDEKIHAWKLGYTRDLWQDWYGMQSDDPIENRSAYTIPYFVNGEFRTIDFRYENVNGHGKYHRASRLGTAPFITLPSMTSGLCVLHEGAKKAMVAQAHCARDEFQVISYPSEGSWQCVIPVLSTYERIVVWGDPGSWCEKVQPGKKSDPSWIAWPLRLAKAVKTAWPKTEVQVVDFGRSDDTDKVDDMILNCEITRDKYLYLLDTARPLARIRVLRH